MQRERERQRHRQREKQAPCREADVGLDPGSPGSCPGLQAALNRCATGAALKKYFIIIFSVSSTSNMRLEPMTWSLRVECCTDWCP